MDLCERSADYKRILNSRWISKLHENNTVITGVFGTGNPRLADKKVCKIVFFVPSGLCLYFSPTIFICHTYEPLLFPFKTLNTQCHTKA